MELESILTAAFGILILIEATWFVRSWQRNLRRPRPRLQVIRYQQVWTRGWREEDDR